MEELGLRDYVTVLRRWHKLFAFTVLVILAASLTVALRWSNYRSTATVQIEQPEISSNVTAPAGGDGDAARAAADQHLGELQQKVESTSSLIDLITKLDLYPGARKHRPIADVAGGMRKKIKVEFIDNPLKSTATSPAIAFSISFDYNDPLLAQQATDELVTRFLDEDLKERHAQAQTTSDFLAAQITAMEESMSEQEKKIADFEKQHGVTRPDELAFNQQAAANIGLNLQNLSSQISGNEGTIGSLRGQMASIDPYARVMADGQILTTPAVQLKALQSQYATLTAQYGADYPDVIKVKHQIEALQAQTGARSGTADLHAQITDTRTNLAAAEKTYGPEHPDVVALKDKLQKLEDAMVRHPSGRLPGTNGVVGDADNPAYLQVASQLQAAEDQHKILLDQQGELQKQQQIYQNAIIANPEAEKEMASLSRDYDNAQLRYRELKEKKMAADMDLQMQQDRKGQRLSVINPPELPGGTHPARLILALGGMLFSLLGGLTAVAAAQMWHQSVIGSRQLAMIAGAAPLVCIPYIMTEQERSRALIRNPLMLWNAFVQRLGLT
ncbi:MAG: hypothetical protein P4M15_11200 [Alphaproteobacteria bacterium]|nr:hypothetical protein [Alphaproteobacteria bacterium]